MKNLLFGIVILFALGTGYFFAKNFDFKIESKKTVLNSEKELPPATSTPDLVGDDSDEHGCKGSAGYSWCETKQKCLRIWEEPCENISPTPAVEENADLAVIIKQLLVVKHGSSAETLNVTVSKREGEFARGGASGQGGGGMWLAKKTDNQWELVFDGNGAPDCQELKTVYLFPDSMLLGVCD